MCENFYIFFENNKHKEYFELFSKLYPDSPLRIFFLHGWSSAHFLFGIIGQCQLSCNAENYMGI